METYQIVQLVVFVVCVAFYLLKRIWGINLLSYVIQARPVLIAITSVLDAVARILPSPHLTTVIEVLRAAALGAESAEQLWIMGDLEKEERNEYAKQLAEFMLISVGVEVNEQTKKIIAGVIEVVCILLPHGVEPEPQKKITEE